MIPGVFSAQIRPSRTRISMRYSPGCGAGACRALRRRRGRPGLALNQRTQRGVDLDRIVGDAGRCPSRAERPSRPSEGRCSGEGVGHSCGVRHQTPRRLPPCRALLCISWLGRRVSSRWVGSRVVGAPPVTKKGPPKTEAPFCAGRVGRASDRPDGYAETAASLRSIVAPARHQRAALTRKRCTMVCFMSDGCPMLVYTVR